MDLIANYGLFLAKIVTVIAAIGILVTIIVNVAGRKRHQRGELRLTNLSEQYQEMQEEMQVARLDGHQQKLWHKAQKKKHKLEAKQAKARAKRGETVISGKPTLYVLDFKGSMDAHEVTSLRCLCRYRDIVDLDNLRQGVDQTRVLECNRRHYFNAFAQRLTGCLKSADVLV